MTIKNEKLKMKNGARGTGRRRGGGYASLRLVTPFKIKKFGNWPSGVLLSGKIARATAWKSMAVRLREALLDQKNFAPPQHPGIRKNLPGWEQHVFEDEDEDEKEEAQKPNILKFIRPNPTRSDH
jgi:hypothetical protein